jgi:hypothetical protein
MITGARYAAGASQHNTHVPRRVRATHARNGTYQL